MAAGKSASLLDVARAAGVSLATASRVLSGSGYPVSAETARKVISAAERLEYQPNMLARNLKRQRSDVAGLVVRDMANPYFLEITRGVTERGNQLGLMIIICNTARDARVELEYHEMLWEHQVGGIILAGGGRRGADFRNALTRQAERFRTKGRPLVALAPQGIDLPGVMVDNRRLGRMLTEHLLGLGHAEVAFIGGPEDVVTSYERYLGYRDALRDAGIPESPHLVRWESFIWDGGYRAAVSLVEAGARFTAVCVSNDSMALGCLQALKERGMRVPEDVSVAGMGNLPFAEYSSPALTTAAIPLYDMGARAVDLVNQAMHGESLPERSVLLDPVLVERASTGPSPGR
ncbi:MAG: LacI family transcriptional regulator [Firmicutes bacterium]|jgi:LacI family transcriptional regulator|nr:LacI family transcriptional regulator [Bacillota bacterium]